MQRDPCHGSVGLRGVAPRLDASTPARQTLTKPEFRPRSPRAKRWIPALWQWEFVPVPVVADIRLGLQTPPPDGSYQSIIQGAHSARRLAVVAGAKNESAFLRRFPVYMLS